MFTVIFVHAMFWVGVYETTKKVVIPTAEKLVNNMKKGKTEVIDVNR